jgi:chromosome segregation protein
LNFENELVLVNEKYKLQQEKYDNISKNKMVLVESNSLKDDLKNSLNLDLNFIKKELNGTNNTINDNLSQEEIRIMNEFYDKEKELNKLVKEINEITKSKNELQEEINQVENCLKKENLINAKKQDALKELEIQTSRLDVKLDVLLNRLNEEYNLNFEHAKEKYKLEIKDDVARSKVNNLKKEIKNLGNVNIGAIEEYERINTRYKFLNSQKDDLENAEITLLEIIKQMDEIMEEEFTLTFNLIKERFKETFAKLFNGGVASLKMTDPTNILETGIEIIASPPGKKLSTISLLSGGEKTLTAIALLFAILIECPVPYCLLDEIEAALDEVNVDKFGQYLETFKNKTQFIIITHKKKTMEYVDTLYGITMPEAGISKLVSVRLEELK